MESYGVEGVPGEPVFIRLLAPLSLYDIAQKLLRISFSMRFASLVVL